jgi:hypothetical protein
LLWRGEAEPRFWARVGAGGIGGLEVGEVLLLLALPTRFGFPEDMALRANGEWNEGSSDYLCVCVCVCVCCGKKRVKAGEASQKRRLCTRL